MSTNDSEALAKTSFFGALREDAIDFLRERATTVNKTAGEDFFSQGEPGDAVYVLTAGRVAVLKSRDDEQVTLAELEAGDLFGEMALVAISKRNATVRALEDCQAISLRNMAILELYEHDLEQFTLLQMNLGRDMARRLTRANQALFEARCQGFRPVD